MQSKCISRMFSPNIKETKLESASSKSGQHLSGMLSGHILIYGVESWSGVEPWSGVVFWSGIFGVGIYVT